MERTYKYLGYFLILLIPLTFAGFYNTYFSQFPKFGEKIDVLVHLHALFATIWIVILISQPILVYNKKYKLHRLIGKFSYIIFPLLIISFIPRMINTALSEDIRNLFFPLGDCILLIVFYTLAIYNRKRTTKHMRFMIAVAIVFLGPTVGRIGPNLLEWNEVLTQFFQYTITYLILLILIIYDRLNNREYRPYLIAIIGYLVHMTVFYMTFIYF